MITSLKNRTQKIKGAFGRQDCTIFWDWNWTEEDDL